MVTPNLIVYFITYCVLYIIRLLRWVAIVQQHEYRFDRLIAFFQSPEGHRELFLPVNFAYSKPTLKRPKLTPKTTLVLSTTLILSLLFLTATATKPTTLILTSIMCLVLLPLITFAASLPLSLLTLLIALNYQRQAKQLIHTHQPTIVGITGSYGKTSTKIILHQLLKSHQQVWTSPKSFNTALSLPQSFVHTYRGEPFLVIEYAAYKKGEIRQLTRIFPPHTAIITGITHQHLALFRSLLHIIQAKSELAHALPPGADLIYNDHDKPVQDLVRPFKHLQHHPISQQPLRSTRLNSQGKLAFSLTPKLTVQTQIIGHHYLTNLQLAITTAKLYGITPSHIKSSLERFRPPSEFIQLHSLSQQGLLILDDKSTNPKGFEAIIHLAKHFSHYHKILVSSGIIDLADQSDTIHHHLGQQTDQVFDLFIHTTILDSRPLQTALKQKYLRTINAKHIHQLLSKMPPGRRLIVIEGRIPSDIQTMLLNL